MKIWHIVSMIIGLTAFIGTISGYIIRLMILSESDKRYVRIDTCKIIHKQTDETNTEIKETLRELNKKIDDLKDLFIKSFARKVHNGDN